MYLSDIAYSAFTGVTPRSNLEWDNATPIRVNGVLYTKGIGTHATSSVTYSVSSIYNLFRTQIGHSSNSGCGDGVYFEIRTNTLSGLPYTSGTVVYTSAVMTSATPIVTVPDICLLYTSRCV